MQLEEEKIKNKNLLKLNEEIISNSNENIKNNSLEQNKMSKINKDLTKIIENLNEKLEKFPFTLEKNEKLMSIIFNTINEKINFPIICKNTDKIIDLEKYFFEEFPEYSNIKIEYIYEGKHLDRFKTLEDYNIKNGKTIIIK